MTKDYKEIKDRIEYLTNYYLDLQDYIERFSFPRIDYYYLIKNISKFYIALDKAKYYLEKEDVEKAIKFIPQKIDYKRKTYYENIVSTKYVLDYIDKILEEDKENQETDKNEFKQENKDI